MFLKVAKAMLPITAGVIPFGLVMGTVASNAKLDFIQTVGMNFFVFAGASQLAAVDLMLQKASSAVIIATGLIINLRFILYSAAFSPFMKDTNILSKMAVSYSLTDQSYTATMANEKLLHSTKDYLEFYFGAALVMIFAWQSGVILGFIFGNFAPSSLALDYAVPLSFVALVIPTMKGRNYVYVAGLASILSLLLKPMPYNLGLLVSAVTSIGFGAFLTRTKKHRKVPL
jgi:predicted branched-subunit amino acid permease